MDRLPESMPRSPAALPSKLCKRNLRSPCMPDRDTSQVHICPLSKVRTEHHLCNNLMSIAIRKWWADHFAQLSYILSWQAFQNNRGIEHFQSVCNSSCTYLQRMLQWSTICIQSPLCNKRPSTSRMREVCHSKSSRFCT